MPIRYFGGGTIWLHVLYVTFTHFTVVYHQSQGAIEIYTAVEINAYLFQMGCQLPSATSDPPFELSFGNSLCGVEQTC